MTDVFSELLGGGDGASAFTRPPGGDSSFFRQRRSAQGARMSPNDLYNTGSQSPTRISVVSRKRARSQPDDYDCDGDGSSMPAKKRPRLSGRAAHGTAGGSNKLSPMEMARFMFSQFYAAGGNWVVLRGRQDVRMTNPGEGEDDQLECRGSLRGDRYQQDGGHPPSRPSSPGGAHLRDGGRRRGHNDNNHHQRQRTAQDLFDDFDARGGGVRLEREDDGEDGDMHAGDQPITGQFSRSYRYDAMVASKIRQGTYDTSNGALMMMNSMKPLAWTAVMHPVYRRELTAKFERFRRDNFNPEHTLCPICVFGACDRQAALAGNSGGGNNAVANFFVMYAHDRENVNDYVLHTSLANYWNHYIFRPYQKVRQANGCAIRPSHVEYHFTYCMDCSNPVAVIAEELRENRIALKTMREHGLYQEALNHGKRTGRISVSPLINRQQQMLSVHVVNLARQLQGVSWNEKTLARMTASLDDSTNSRIQFDSGQVSYAGALNQFGKYITHKKAQQAGSLL